MIPPVASGFVKIILTPWAPTLAGSSAKAAAARMIGEPFKLAKETTNIVYAADSAPLKIRYAKKPDRKPWRIAVFQDHDGVIVGLSNISLASSNDAPYVLATEGGSWCGKTASNGSKADLV